MLASECVQWDDLSPEEQQADMECLEQFDQVCAARDGVEILATEALDSGSTSTTVRISQGREVTITGWSVRQRHRTIVPSATTTGA
jgi:hypothetical protein